MGFSFTPTTYVYMLVNKKVTLARFGRILSETEWTRFREFMNTCIREKRQSRGISELNRTKKK